MLSLLMFGYVVERLFELMNGLWQSNDVWSAFIADMLARHLYGLLPRHA